MTIRGPLIYNRPLGQANQNPPGFIQGRVGGPSGGKQFAGNGQWKAYDWPNPNLLPDSKYLASYLRVEGPTRNISLLLGKDKQFGGPGQFKTYDYPNPRGYEHPVVLRTWIDPTKSQLIGKDKQFGGAGFWKAYDYPNPLGPRQPIDSLTWSQNLLQETLKPSAQLPFSQTDWQNPKGYSRNESLGWLNTGNALTGTVFMPPLSWTIELVRRISIQVDNPVNLVILAPTAPPLNQRDWPLPIGSQFPTDLRTWLLSVRINLIGKDKIYGGTVPNYDWPNPSGPVGSIELRSWLQNLSQTTLSPPFVQPPFNLLDWQNPNGYLFPSDLRTFGDPNYINNPIPQPPIPPVPSVTSSGGGRWFGYCPTYEEKQELKEEIKEVVREKKSLEIKIQVSPNRVDLLLLVEELNAIQKRLDKLVTEFASMMECVAYYQREEEEEFLMFIAANL